MSMFSATTNNYAFAEPVLDRLSYSLSSSPPELDLYEGVRLDTFSVFEDTLFVAAWQDDPEMDHADRDARMEMALARAARVPMPSKLPPPAIAEAEPVSGNESVERRSRSPASTVDWEAEVGRARNAFYTLEGALRATLGGGGAGSGSPAAKSPSKASSNTNANAGASAVAATGGPKRGKRKLAELGDAEGGEQSTATAGRPAKRARRTKSSSAAVVLRTANIANSNSRSEV